MKDKGYIISDYIQGEKINPNPTKLSLNNIKAENMVYLAYFDEKQEEYICSHQLKRV